MKLKNDIYVYEWTNYFDNNCNSFYIGGDVKALVDPGLTRYLPDLLNQMSADGIRKEDIRYVINTHSHPDHFQGSELFDPETVKIALHAKELEFLKGVGGELYGVFGITVPQMHINLPLEEGNIVLDEQIFKIILAPGHSPGSIALYWPEQKALFFGDVMFRRKQFYGQRRQQSNLFHDRRKQNLRKEAGAQRYFSFLFLRRENRRHWAQWVRQKLSFKNIGRSRHGFFGQNHSFPRLYCRLSGAGTAPGRNKNSAANRGAKCAKYHGSDP